MSLPVVTCDSSTGSFLSLLLPGRGMLVLQVQRHECVSSEFGLRWRCHVWDYADGKKYSLLGRLV